MRKSVATEGTENTEKSQEGRSIASFGCVVPLCSLWLALALSAQAQPYPNKPIRMIVISAPGGSTDTLSRMVGRAMSESMGQTIVLDNKPGGGGIIASETLAKAPPDGYTILMTNTSHTVLPSLHSKLPYDPIKDFAPVSLVALTHSLLLVNPTLPVKNVKELIELARAQPGKLNYASGTTGASAHYGAELLKLMAKVNIVQVPYKGTAGHRADCGGSANEFRDDAFGAAAHHRRPSARARHRQSPALAHAA
jgi:tripartite-type tricarboxylate transporter receptor subunit TctC